MTRASIARLAPCAIALAIAAACGPSQSQTSSSPPPAAAPAAPAQRPTETVAGPALDPELAPIVDGYRKVIVLLESEDALDADARQRAVLVGRLIYQENHQRLSSLTEALTAELGGTAPLDKTTKFLDALEANPELHDADKLAFLDVVTEIADTLHASRAPASSKMLAGRVDSDVQALKEIQGLYNKELDRIFGRFDTRGMPVRREAWDAYVTFLRTRYAPAAILKEYNDAVKAVTGVRAAGGRVNESLLEISGTKESPDGMAMPPLCRRSRFQACVAG